MKAFNYAMILVVLAIFLQIGGFQIGESLLNLVGISGSTVDFEGASFFTKLFGDGTGYLILAAAGSIIAGLISRAKPENYIVLPFITTTFITFLGLFTGIILAAQAYPTWVQYIVLIIVAPLGIGFLMSLVDWFRGID